MAAWLKPKRASASYSGAPEFRVFFPIDARSPLDSALTTADLSSKDACIEQRTDDYIVILNAPEYGLKMRAGKTLELKRRTAVLREDSRVEFWVKSRFAKYSLPIASQSSASEHAEDGHSDESEVFQSVKYMIRAEAKRAGAGHMAAILDKVSTEPCVVCRVHKARDSLFIRELNGCVEFAECCVRVLATSNLHKLGFEESAAESGLEAAIKAMRERVEATKYQSICVEGTDFRKKSVRKALNKFADAFPSDHLVGGYPIWLATICSIK